MKTVPPSYRPAMNGTSDPAASSWEVYQGTCMSFLPQNPALRHYPRKKFRPYSEFLRF